MTTPQIEFRPAAALIPYARNSRTHSAAQVAQIAASIVEFGFTSPVLADAGGIVAGHGRVLAVLSLCGQGKGIHLAGGHEVPAGCVPVLDCSGWTDAQRRAYVIADNKLALNAGRDDEMLRIELDDLEAQGFDIDLLGFEADELSGLAGEGDGVSEQVKESAGIDYVEKFAVLVDCTDEAEQEQTFNRLSSMGFTCKVLVN